jgi:hypothetical protein
LAIQLIQTVDSLNSPLFNYEGPDAVEQSPVALSHCGFWADDDNRTTIMAARNGEDEEALEKRIVGTKHYNRLINYRKRRAQPAGRQIRPESIAELTGIEVDDPHASLHGGRSGDFRVAAGAVTPMGGSTLYGNPTGGPIETNSAAAIDPSLGVTVETAVPEASQAHQDPSPVGAPASMPQATEAPAAPPAAPPAE